MARFYPTGGTGGANVSVVTALAEDVAKGKVIVGPDGKPITGTLELTGTAADSQVLASQTYYNTDLKTKRTGAMTNRGAWNSSEIAAGAEVTIPAGYHNGGGKVTAKDLASQTPGDATAAQIWTGKKAWVNGKQITGTLATQGGSTTIPGTAAKTIVTPNKIVTGNIAVAGDANLVAGNIKKNVTIFGVKGTCEGWFPTATDLYLRGQNPAGFYVDPSSTRLVMEAGGIHINGFVQDKVYLITTKQYNLSPYNFLNVEIYYDGKTSPDGIGYTLSRGSGGIVSNLGYQKPNLNTMNYISFPLSNINYQDTLEFRFSSQNSISINGVIYRFWLS